MNLENITPKSYILALIIRDDGERFLLGDGAYEFKQNQLHFNPNTYANDVVELQGSDGQMLAGQVRRTQTQTFDGYIGDASVSKEKIEQYRRAFFMFFRKKHYYTVAYIFANGSSIQRRRGYITDAPSVQELWQKFPEYHIGLNFEDPNYYEYAEDENGNEIYAHIMSINLSSNITGGLIWDAIGAITNSINWKSAQAAQGAYINITNSLDIPAALSEVEIQGNTTQTTYTGKNLLPMKNTTRTINSVTFTPRADGSIALSGTASAQTNYPINVNSSNVSRDVTIPTGSYVVDDGIETANIYVQAFYQETGGSIVYKSGSFTTTAEAVLGAYIRVNSGTNTNGTVVYPMLVSGTVAGDYEPYVGGTASPNPDFPQAVNTVTGEQTVKNTGKNLFDLNATPIDTTNASYIISGQKITVTTSSSAQAAKIEIPFDYVANEEITVSFDAKVISNNAGSAVSSVVLRTHGGSDTIPINNNLDLTVGQTTHYSRTFTTDNNTRALWLYTKAQNVSGERTIEYSNIQIEYGSATTYEPYQGESKEVNLGKNLELFTSYDASVQREKIYTLTNELIPETYTISFDISSISLGTNTSFSPYFQIKKTDNTNIVDLNLMTISSSTTTGRYSKTFSLPANGSLNDRMGIRIPATPYNNGARVVLSNIQLEKGSTATTYAPYFTPIELCKIATYQDKIYKQGDDWFVHKEIGKVVFDGTETGWGYNSSNKVFWGRYSDLLPNSGFTTSTTGYWAKMSDNFTYYAQSGNNATLSDGLYENSSATHQSQLLFHYSAITSLADWKTWLGNNPTTVYYALATPYDTQITDQALIDQLEALGNTKLYVGANNITTTYTEGNAQATLKLSYYTAYDMDGTGYEWEAGGNPRNIVSVDGVDDAQPIWEVVGPAQNPTITNITTGQTLTWNGFVPSGQTLTVDMGEMTATLAGANVFEYISGTWITLDAGNNIITYSASGGATDPSTLSWNGVVG